MFVDEKGNVVKDPGETTPQAGGTENPEDAQGQQNEQSSAPDDKEGVASSEEPRIPKSRLDEESGKRRAAELESANLKARLEMLESLQSQQTQSFDDKVRDYAAKTGLGEEEVRHLINLQAEQVKPMFAHLLNQQANLAVEIALNKLQSKPDFDKMEGEIRQQLSTLDPQTRSDPRIAEQVYYWARGKKLEEMERDDHPGKVKGKKIISSPDQQFIPKVEGSSIPAVSVKHGSFTESEIKEAKDKNLTVEQLRRVKKNRDRIIHEREKTKK